MFASKGSCSELSRAKLCCIAELESNLLKSFKSPSNAPGGPGPKLGSISSIPLGLKLLYLVSEPVGGLQHPFGRPLKAFRALVVGL